MDLAAKADSDASADESDGRSESGSDDSFVVPDGNEEGSPMPFDQAAAAQERDEMHAAARRFEAEDSGPSGIEMHESGTDLGSEAGEGGDGIGLADSGGGSAGVKEWRREWGLPQ